MSRGEASEPGGPERERLQREATRKGPWAACLDCTSILVRWTVIVTDSEGALGRMPRLAALTRRELRLPGRLPRRHTRTASESCTSRPHWTPAHERGREHGALLPPLAQEASYPPSPRRPPTPPRPGGLRRGFQCPRGRREPVPKRPTILGFPGARVARGSGSRYWGFQCPRGRLGRHRRGLIWADTGFRCPRGLSGGAPLVLAGGGGRGAGG